MLKIPVCYSFDAPVLTEFLKDEYIPVGCGGYSSAFMKYTDAFGENISKYNSYINELTMIYWVAKNYNVIGNPDYIGFAHYRRYLLFERERLSNNSIICSLEDQPASLYLTYCAYHIKSDLDFFTARFSAVRSDLDDEMKKYFSQNRHAKCNMFVMSRSLFFDYFSFIEPCIRICIDEMIPALDLDSRDRYQKRALGFILERMTGFWVYLQQRRGTEISSVNIVEEPINSIYSRQHYA